MRLQCAGGAIFEHAIHIIEKCKGGRAKRKSQNNGLWDERKRGYARERERRVKNLSLSASIFNCTLRARRVLCDQVAL